MKVPTTSFKAVALCCASLGSSLAGAQPGDWQVQAEQALRQALASRHPTVTTWHLTALADVRQQQRLAERTVTSAEAARLGKRSAVHLRCEKTPRPCATVWFAVKGVQSVLTSKRELPPLHPVSRADFAIQPFDVMNLSCPPLVSSDGLTGLRTRRALGAGAAVCAGFLETRPAVSRGQPVEVRVTAGPVAITAQAVAQQDAALGQRVRIKRSDSAAAILAIVTGSGQVAVGDFNE